MEEFREQPFIEFYFRSIGRRITPGNPSPSMAEFHAALESYLEDLQRKGEIVSYRHEIYDETNPELINLRIVPELEKFGIKPQRGESLVMLIAREQERKDYLQQKLGYFGMELLFEKESD